MRHRKITRNTLSILICAPLSIFAAALLPAQEAGLDQSPSTGIMRFINEPSNVKITHEFDAKAGYVFPSATRIEGNKIGNVDEVFSSIDYVLSPEISKDFIPRFGLQWERYSYGHSTAIPIPNTLQFTAAILGFDAALNDEWLVRFEAKPGIYSDFEDVGASDINVPFILGASWLVDTDLQVFAGVSVDLFRQFPVLPGIGVRWEFADDWTLFFVPPEPRLVYKASDDLEIYAGADILGTSARVGKSFGSSVGRPGLNDTVVDLFEIRAGAGLTYKITNSISANVEGGYMVWREFDYHRANFHPRNDPAPYAQLSLSGSF